MSLPRCCIQTPACGACGDDTAHDGDSFYCDDCGLDYGNGDESDPAVFRDEELPPCGEACDNNWHIKFGLTCTPCELPAGHTSDHWTDCK
ncbi:hypothetical protein ACVWZ8_004368 [Arthrobacter sp. UYCu723]